MVGPESLRILLVEDSEEDARVLSAHLKAEGLAAELTRVDELEPLRAAFGTGGWDILLADFALPGMDGLEVLREARRLAPNLPCIVVSGQIGEEAAVAALRAGAKDFVSKFRLARLVPALQRELAESRLRAGADQTRAELRTSEDRFRAITEVALDAIVMMDPEGRVSFWNPAAQRLFGYTEQEALGLALHDLIALEPNPPAFEQGFAGFLETGQGGAMGKVTELSGRRKDGAEFPIELSLAALRVGEAWHAVGVVRDITERRRAEEALQEAHDRLQALSRRLLEIQETERRQLARELHDEIGQVLTATKINLQSLRQFPDPATLAARLEDSAAIVERALSQVRSLSLELCPPMLIDLGLGAALRWLFDQQAQRTGLQVAFPGGLPDTRFEGALEMATFRVAQEALTNIVKHASAQTITVDLKAYEGTLHLRVQDDGAGFDVEAMRHQAGQGASLGLISMQERAMLAGGGIEWVSDPGQGTEVHAWFPVNPRTGCP